MVWLAVAGMSVGACSNSDSATPASVIEESPPVSSTTVATPDSAPAPTTTVDPVAESILLPAGIQYDDTPTSISATFGSLDSLADDSGWFAIGPVPSNVPKCAGGTPGQCTTFAENPAFYSGTAPESLTPTLIDDVATYPTPAGFGQPTYLIASAVVQGTGGFVAVGFGAFWDSNLFRAGTSRAQIWFSPDGVSWQRVTMPAGLEGRLGQLTSVSATESGYVAVGQVGVGDDLNAGPSQGVVLTSADGLTWTQSAQLATPWAVSMESVHSAGNLLIASGVTYVCDFGASAMVDFSVGAQTLVWSSTDNGTTWNAVDLAGLDLAADRPDTSTLDTTACAALDLSARDELSWGLGGAFLLDDTFVLVASDGSATASSSDLASWTPAAVPNGAAAAYEGIDNEPAERAAYAADGELILLSAEMRRTADGFQSGFGTSVFGWRSTDNGATWTQLPLARPLDLAGKALLAVFSNGSVALAVDGVDAAGGDTRTLTFSSAGELRPWETCTPVAGADCAFAIAFSETAVAGANLAGINLTGVSLPEVVLDGADLTGAVFVGADVNAASFIGANLTNASFVNSSLNNATMTDATLTGADFTNARLPGTILQNSGVGGAVLVDATIYFSADAPTPNLALSGLNLRKVSFSGPSTGIANLQGSSFAGSTLAGTFFNAVDLTGADFTGAIFTDDSNGGSVLFSSGVICPDGAPKTEGEFGQAACRL